MLIVSPKASGTTPVEWSDAQAREPARWSMQALLSTLRRRSASIILTTVAVLAAAVAFLLFAQERYSAEARIVIDVNRRGLTVGSEAANSSAVDMAVVESQVETIQSEKIALAVIRKLDLDQDSEFIGRPGVVDHVLALMMSEQGPSATRSPEERLRTATDTFKKNLDVARVGRSYIARIAFTSRDPDKAARIANAITDVYIEDQLEARFEATERAGNWMQQRLAELRQEATRAENAVTAFKNLNGIADNTAAREAPGVAQRLRTLEGEAQAKRASVDSLTALSAYTQTLHQQSPPVTDARVVTQATAPQNKSYPKTALTLVLALFTGGAMGTMVAFAREHLDRTIRRPQQIEAELGLRTLGVLPHVPARVVRPSVSAAPNRWQWTKRLIGGTAGPMTAPLFFFPEQSKSAATADVLRRINMEIEQGLSATGGSTIGIVSSSAGEGKTTIAYNLALVAGQGGRRVLLIDADFRSSRLMNKIASPHSLGLLDLLDKPEGLAESVIAHRSIHVLGQSKAECSAHPADILSSGPMGRVIEAARKDYDWIIIDLPSLLRHVEAQAGAIFIDTFVFVAEAGATTIDDIEQALRQAPVIAGRIGGVVINNAASTATT